MQQALLEQPVPLALLEQQEQQGRLVPPVPRELREPRELLVRLVLPVRLDLPELLVPPMLSRSASPRPEILADTRR